jgi:hypothetical protein
MNATCCSQCLHVCQAECVHLCSTWLRPHLCSTWPRPHLCSHLHSHVLSQSLNLTRHAPACLQRKLVEQGQAAAGSGGDDTQLGELAGSEVLCWRRGCQAARLC